MVNVSLIFMNAEICTTEQAQEPAGNDSESPRHTDAKQRRRRGKIARLPRKLRDRVNQLLDDGTSYPDIISQLQESKDPPLPYSISENNLSNWHDGGFQDWLKHQEELDRMDARLDFALDLAEGERAAQLQDLSLKLASIRFCEYLSQVSLADLSTEDERKTYLRLLMALPRISREALNLQKYRDEIAATKAAEKPKSGPFFEYDPETVRLSMLKTMDEIMGLKSYAPVAAAPDLFRPKGRAASPPGAAGRAACPQGADSAIPNSATAASPESDSPYYKPLEPIIYQTPNGPVYHYICDGTLPEATQADAPSSSLEGNTQSSPQSQPASTPESTHTPSPQPENIPVNPVHPVKTSAQPEFCLECGEQLPPLIPNVGRPERQCPHCRIPLPPVGTAREPSNEQCPNCRSKLPRLLPDGTRPSVHCHICGAPLPEPKP